jgi:hypothetical protein
MRRAVATAGFVGGIGAMLLLACGGSSAPISAAPDATGGGAGADEGGPAGDSGGPGPGTDAGGEPDGDASAPVDASCPLPVSPDPAACVHDDDCATVDVGCYCGAQPVDGVAKAFAAASAACEAKSASSCARGCVSFPGQVAQDGRSSSQGTIMVHCVPSASGSVCKTFVP